MNLVKCSNGHFYDGDKYASCPHCSTQPSDSMTVAMPSGDSDSVTVALKPAGSQEPVTVARPDSQEPVTAARYDTEPVTQKDSGRYADTPSYQEAMETVQSAVPVPVLEDEGVTVSYYGQKFSEPAAKDPVVGWLVCTKGDYFGQSFNLKSGRNFVGRGPQMDVCLSGEASVSRDRHAVIIYEPVGRMFLAQAGDSRELFYVNGSVVLENVKLKPYDVVSVGKVDLIFVPCCTNEFAWDDLEKKTER